MKKEGLNTKSEILGGLKAAVERGSSLKEAMMTFYHSGYDKDDIEAAAKQYIESGHSKEPVFQKEIEPKKKQNKIKRLPKNQIVQPVKPIQKVSKYESKKEKGKIMTILLAVVLFLLIGILAAVVLFKDQLTKFLSSIF